MPTTIVSLLCEQHGEAMRELVGSVASAVDASACRLALVDPRSRDLVVAAVHPPPSGVAAPAVTTSPEPVAATVPLLDAGQPIGMLTAEVAPGTDPRDLTARLQRLAPVVTRCVLSLRELATASHQRVLLESLTQVSKDLIETADEGVAFTALLDQLWRVLRYDAGVFALLGDGVLETVAVRGGEEGRRVEIAEVGGLQGLLRARQPGMLDPQVGGSPRFGMPPADVTLVVPLATKEVTIGAFVLAYSRAEQVSERLAKLARTFADHAGLFVDAARLLARERRARARGSTLSRITRTVARTADRKQITIAATEQMLELSGAERAILYLGHARNAILIPQRVAGALEDEMERAMALRLNLEEERLAPLNQDRLPVLLEKREDVAGISPFPRARSVLLIPLVSRDVLMGAVALFSLSRAPIFDPVQVELLGSVAQQFALGIENTRLLAELTRLANTDEMTRLCNRRRLMEVFHVRLRQSRERGEPLSLLLVDMDHLKRVNDTHGHAVGDRAIAHVGGVLRRHQKGDELAARIGGEEFAVLLPDHSLEQGHAVAEDVRRQLSNAFLPEVGLVTASIGVACCPQDGTTPSELLKVADARLYRAKDAGRNQVCSSTLPTTIPPTDELAGAVKS